MVDDVPIATPIDVHEGVFLRAVVQVRFYYGVYAMFVPDPEINISNATYKVLTINSTIPDYTVDAQYSPGAAHARFVLQCKQTVGQHCVIATHEMCLQDGTGRGWARAACDVALARAGHTARTARTAKHGASAGNTCECRQTWSISPQAWTW